MKAKGLRILRIHGIDVYLHFSWWFVFALLVYGLANEHGFFMERYPELSGGGLWLLAIAGAIGLFASVLLHELVHSFVARAFKIKVDHITLFFFGGVASLPTEDMKPKTEFWMALAGPLFSIVLGGVLFVVHSLVGYVAIKAVTGYLWQLNIVLGMFNLAPGYPLDGGRVFRAVLMFYYNDIRKATYVASWGGKLFGGFLVFLGFVGIVAGAAAGLWFVLLGAFLWFIAQASYEQVVMKSLMSSIHASDVLEKDYQQLDAGKTYFDVVRLFQSTLRSSALVMRNDKLLGLVELQRLPRVSREMQRTLLVRSMMIPVEQLNVGGMHEHGYELLRKMDEQGLRVLPIVEKGKVKGIVRRGALMHMMALRMRAG